MNGIFIAVGGMDVPLFVLMPDSSNGIDDVANTLTLLHCVLYGFISVFDDDITNLHVITALPVVNVFLRLPCLLFSSDFNLVYFEDAYVSASCPYLLLLTVNFGFLFESRNTSFSKVNFWNTVVWFAMSLLLKDVLSAI